MAFFKKIKKHQLLLAFFVIIGLAIRIAYLLGSPFTPDESAYGLAMVHILNGKPWPVFFYAQPYTGTQSAILAVFLAKILGFHPYFLKVIPLLFSVGLIVANYFLAKKISPKQPLKAGLLSALFTALLPAFAQNWGVRAGSGYPEVALVGSLCLFLGVKLLYDKLSPKQTNRLFFLLGLLAGFGYWVQPAIAYFLLPLAGLLFLWQPKFFRKKWFYLALLGVIIGSFPVILFNLKNNLNTGRALLNKPGGIKHAWVIFFTEGMPVILGTRASWTRVDHFFPLAIVIWLIYAIVALLPTIALFKKAIAWGKSFSNKRPLSWWQDLPAVFLARRETVLVLLVLFTPLIFSLSPFNWFVIEPRYIYAPLYVALPVLLSLFLARLNKKVSFAIIVLVLANNLLSMGATGKNSRPTSFEAQTNLTPVIELLRQKNIHYVYSSFMFCHRLVFESKEDIICTPFEGGFGEIRYPIYKQMVKNAPKEEKGFVFLTKEEGAQETADNYTPALDKCQDDLSKQHNPCKEKIIGNIRVSWYR